MGAQILKGYTFGPFRLDAGKRLLFEAGEIVPLAPRAFDTLLALVENGGTVMGKEELMRSVWCGEFVEENNLAQCIHAIRKALGDGLGGLKYVETISKRGYRFVAGVELITDQPITQVRESGSDHRPGTNVDQGTQRDGSRDLPLAPHVVQRTYIPVSPKTQYAVSTGDVNIAYQVVGNGPLDLVFVMGWVTHIEQFWQEPSFSRFLTRLASFSRLILFDKRGTGLSDRVPANELPTLEQRMTDVQAVMDAVGSERAALLGVSEGGPMCSLFAASHPERTVALVMIGTYAKRVWAEDYPWAPTEIERAVFLELLRSSWGQPVGLEERAPSVADDLEFREWWSTYLRLGASPGAAVALTQMNAEIDVRQVLPSIRVPTLVIHRVGDACLKVEEGRYVASAIPGARYVELEGRDHLPFVGDQDSILDEVEEFLTGARHERLIDRVLTTVLFVIFGDDAQSISLPNNVEEKELQSTHVRRELALFRGKEIEMTATRLCATFDGPARAIRCALAITDAAKRLGFRARAGLHTGECDVLGEQIGGVTVQLGKEVAQVAESGEVLISQTVKDLVAGSGIRFEPRGAHTFAPLAGKWRTYAVGGEAH